jgi:hypothetical protein
VLEGSEEKILSAQEIEIITLERKNFALGKKTGDLDVAIKKIRLAQISL